MKTDRYETGAVRLDVDNSYGGLRSAITTPLWINGASVTYGLYTIRNEMRFDRYNAVSNALTGIFVPPVTLDMLAPYAQVDLPIGRTKLSGGVRHELYSGSVESVGKGTISPTDDGNGGDIRDFNLTLFNVGLLHPLNEQFDWHATFSQGAKITQLGRAAFAASSAELLDPEPATSNQYETGLRYHGRTSPRR